MGPNIDARPSITSLSFVFSVQRIGKYFKPNVRNEELPFNIASYATLLCIFSELLGYVPGKLACVLNNAHIYTSHLSAVEEQLSRDTNMYGAPELKLTGLTDINEISADQIKLKNYKRCKKIKAKMEALS